MVDTDRAAAVVVFFVSFLFVFHFDDDDDANWTRPKGPVSGYRDLDTWETRPFGADDVERASKYPYLGDVPLTRFTPPLLDDDDAFTTLRLDSSYTGFFMYLDMAADTRRDGHLDRSRGLLRRRQRAASGAERTIVLPCWRADMTVTTI